MTSRGYKVTDAERKTRVGIAVKTFEELKQKTLEKFKLPPNTEIVFQTADGTGVENDDYFGTLPAQTLLIWTRSGQRAETDAEILYKTIREVNEEYLKAGEKVQEFFSEKMKTKVFKLAEVLKGIDPGKVHLSTREEHPEWFEGLDTRSKSKEAYMFRRAQDRIRSYYYKTKDDLLDRRQQSDQLNRLLMQLHAALKANKFHGYLFDRSELAPEPLCDRSGLFRCQGRWDKAKCLYEPRHSINPYSSREERIVFQTWNLDHQIERARSVVPNVRQALLKSDKELDVKAIYRDLFSGENLKLVHIVCHDKSAHLTKKAGSYLVA